MGDIVIGQGFFALFLLLLLEATTRKPIVIRQYPSRRQHKQINKWAPDTGSPPTTCGDLRCASRGRNSKEAQEILVSAWVCLETARVIAKRIQFW